MISYYYIAIFNHLKLSTNHSITIAKLLTAIHTNIKTSYFLIASKYDFQVHPKTYCKISQKERLVLPLNSTTYIGWDNVLL